jgi:inositol transport system substrate-binding protein
MNRLLSTLAASAILLTSAMAQNIGVSLAYSDDLFLTTLRQAMEQRAKELGVKIQFDHAQGDIGKQLN